MRANTFLEIHDALINNKPLAQCGADRVGLYNGLCYIDKGRYYVIQSDTFKLFIPEGDCPAYWADEDISECGQVYNSLRQNIILLCAAIEGEL